jgi:uncharacterized membrane protein YoaK (UPF0700 family)
MRNAFGALSLAAALTAIAGYVDAIGFLRLGHLFVSYMSGDSTQFAAFIAGGQWRKAAPAGTIVLLFVASVVIGRMIECRAKAWSRPVILCCEACLLAAAVLASTFSHATTILMVIAMGIQNAAIHRVGETRIGLTYVTGTLVSLGGKLGDFLSGSGGSALKTAATYFSLWAGLVAGAFMGALFYHRIGLNALALPILLLLAFAALTAIEILAEPGSE